VQESFSARAFVACGAGVVWPAGRVTAMHPLVAAALLPAVSAACPTLAQIQCEDDREDFFIESLAEYRSEDRQMSYTASGGYVDVEAARGRVGHHHLRETQP